jgi:hypothetical protein
MNRIPQPEPNDELGRRLTRALEAAPAVLIPEGFAARTAAAAATHLTDIPALTSRFGALATQFAFAVLIVAMLVFAPWASTRSIVPVLLEILLALEFVALSTWLSLRQQVAR